MKLTTTSAASKDVPAYPRALWMGVEARAQRKTNAVGDMDDILDTSAASFGGRTRGPKQGEPSSGHVGKVVEHGKTSMNFTRLSVSSSCRPMKPFLRRLFKRLCS